MAREEDVSQCSKACSLGRVTCVGGLDAGPVGLGRREWSQESRGEGKGLARLGLQGCVQDFRFYSKQNGKTLWSLNQRRDMILSLCVHVY